MSGHVREHCSPPRFFKRFWRHRVWRCDCGKLWHTEMVGAADSMWWDWREVASDDH